MDDGEQDDDDEEEEGQVKEDAVDLVRITVRRTDLVTYTATRQHRNSNSARLRLRAVAVGPLSLTQPDPTQQLTNPTQPVTKETRA